MAKLSVIGQLHRGGQLSPTELAAREGVKIQSLTRLLAELETEGWIVRVCNEADARQSLLSLTPAGRKLLTDAAQEKDTALGRIIDNNFSASERVLLLQACFLLDAHDAALSNGSNALRRREGNIVLAATKAEGWTVKNRWIVLLPKNREVYAGATCRRHLSFDRAATALEPVARSRRMRVF